MCQKRFNARIRRGKPVKTANDGSCRAPLAGGHAFRARSSVRKGKRKAGTFQRQSAERTGAVRENPPVRRGTQGGGINRFYGCGIIPRALRRKGRKVRCYPAHRLIATSCGRRHSPVPRCGRCSSCPWQARDSKHRKGFPAANTLQGTAGHGGTRGFPCC